MPEDLTPEQQAVAELVLVRGRSYGEIAETLDLPPERVKQLAREAAEQLGLGEGPQAEEVHAAATGKDEEEARERARARRRPLPIFAFYVILLVVGIAWAIALGFIRGADDEGARDAVERFAQALDERDGTAACNQLSADTRAELESQEAKPCDEAILDAGLSLGDATKVDAAETSATVELDEGGSVYLEETSNGWRISAVGCEPRPDEPDDCEVKA